MRTLVIGDIHGALKALKQVLKKCKYNPIKDQLIFLGDYVDGWSESAEVINYLIKLKDEPEIITPIFIRGNHDKWCQDWLIDGLIHPYWLPQGGQSTVDSYIRTKFLVKDCHRNFFKSMINYYKDDKNRVFVHGGFVSRKGIGHDAHQANYYWDRDLWGLAIAADKNEADFKGIKNYLRFKKHKEIYIGHTNVLRLGTNKPVKKCNVWNLDTGAGFAGKLTIMDIDTKEFWQSKKVKKLYKQEKGRI